MQKMSVTQFQRYCDEQMFDRYTYDTRTQVWDTIFNPMRVTAEYKIMRTFLSPNSICFKNEQNTLCFDRVKHILCDCAKSPGSVWFVIICGDRSSKERDISYRMEAFRSAK